MAQAGVQPSLKVLYVPDYVTPAQRLITTQQLRDKLGKLIPDHDISLALAEGPFEDSDGVGAHFEAGALGGPEKKQLSNLRRDFHTSVLKLARHAALHKPAIVYGDGQGRWLR